MNYKLMESVLNGCKPILKDDYNHDLYKILKNKRIGDFEIKKKTIPENTEQQYYDQKKGMGRCVFVTDYKIVQLRQGEDSIWMSDTPMEFETNKKAIALSHGDVLECGLGIGLFTYYASKKVQVKSITIVEKEKEVIDLVYPIIKNTKTNVIESNAISFLKNTKQKFDVIHIDIWGDILPYKELDPVLRIAKKKLKPNGIVTCWLDDIWVLIKKNVKKGARVSEGIGWHDPCITCGKTLRNDYGGFCMDCADGLGISDLFMHTKKRKKIPLKANGKYDYEKFLKQQAKDIGKIKL